MQSYLIYKDPIPGISQLLTWRNAIAGAIGGDALGLSTTLAQSTNGTLFSGLAVLDWTYINKTVSDIVHCNRLPVLCETQGCCLEGSISTTLVYLV